MKHIKISLALLLLLLNLGFKNPNNFLTVKVNSKSNNISSSYTIEKWGKNTNIVSIQITNNGTQTAKIENVEIKLNNAPVFNQNSKFMYSSHEMSSDNPIQIRGIDDKQLFTEMLFMTKIGDRSYYKVGILTWEIFRTNISYTKENGIVITAEGEGKPIKAGETILLEKLVFEQGENWQNMMYNYGQQIAKIQNIQPKEIGKWKGWGSWDYYGHNFTMEDIMSNINQIKAMNIDANLIQLDASWWINRGDYLETRPNLPGEMKGVAKVIKENGFMAGLHLDGMRAVNTSNVFKNHPEWFLKDQDNKTILAPFRGQQRVFFDYSNPAVCNYMRNVLKTMTTDWGYDYIKIDFLCYGLNRDILENAKNPNIKSIVAFDTTMTSMERSRAAFKAMREGVGAAYFLGCSSVFGPNLGYIDALRTGPDISPRYESFQSHVLQNAGNFYLNKAVVQNDADYLVVRSKEDEDPSRAQGTNKFGGNVSLSEAAMWTNYITLFGGTKLSSDDINLLRIERKDLTKSAFSIETCSRFIPIDLWDKAKSKTDAFNIILGENKDGVYLALFNWNAEKLSMKLSNIPTNQIELLKYQAYPIFSAKDNTLDITLNGRSSVILKLKKGTNFDEVRSKIVYKF